MVIFLQEHAKELILVDFSDAILEAQRNLAKNLEIIYFMGDL